MTTDLQTLLRLFNQNTQISIECSSKDRNLYTGLLGHLGIFRNADLEVVECEINDNVLRIKLAI